MDFVTLILFILIGTGITNLVVNSTILDNLRDFIINGAKSLNESFGELVETLLSCMMCSGFWIGLITAMFFPIGVLAGACIISLTSHFYGSLIGGLDGLSEFSDSLTVESAEE